MLYFAYGSNMSSRRLRARVPSARAVGLGSIQGRRLAFHKLGSDGSGKCDIPESDDPSDRVHGVLYEIAESDWMSLDRAEGEGAHYHRARLMVDRSDEPTVEAWVYLADARQIRAGLRPTAAYLQHVLEGAREHSVPGAWDDL
jgi:gamma-glutamylcyclotransferase